VAVILLFLAVWQFLFCKIRRKDKTMNVGMLCLLVILFFFTVVYYVLLYIGYWYILKKAGKPGWKGLIPFYNKYLLYDISWETRMYWVFLVLDIIYKVLRLLDEHPLLNLAILILGLIIFVIRVCFYYKLSTVFGYGTGFTIGLLIFEPIFILILGIGSSRYKYTYDSK